MGNSKNAAETAQNEQEWARAEYEAKTKGLSFTKDFQSRQDAVMRDPLATVGERVMAWILRRSWGEFRLFAVRADGEPAFQRDCVRDLGISKKQVSTAVSYYQKRGYLEKKKKLLYPVISPDLTSPQKVTDSGNFSQFMEEWKVTYSSDFEEEKVLRSTLKKKIKVRLSLYKKWKEQKRKASVSLLEITESNTETLPRADLSPLEASNQRHEQTPAKSPTEDRTQSEDIANARKILFDHVEHMQQAFPNTPFARPPINRSDPGDQGLIDRILQETGTQEEDVIGFVVWCGARFKGIGKGGMHVEPRPPGTSKGPTSLGLLVNWAKDYARIAGTRAKGAHE